LGERQHLVGHVQAEGAARRPHASGGEQHVDAAARAQIEDPLAFVKLGHGDWVAAAERCHDGGVGKLVALERRVEAAPVVGGLDAARLAGADAERGFGVVPANRLVDVGRHR
jgi:hypothetical protein